MIFFWRSFGGRRGWHPWLFVLTGFLLVGAIGTGSWLAAVLLALLAVGMLTGVQLRHVRRTETRTVGQARAQEEAQAEWDDAHAGAGAPDWSGGRAQRWLDAKRRARG